MQPIISYITISIIIIIQPIIIIVIGGLDSTHPLGFIPSIGCVVVGHYSLSGKLEEDHFNFVEEGRSNFFPCIDQSTAKIPICVLTGIIKKLSFEGSTVIDATSESGNYYRMTVHACMITIILCFRYPA